MRYRSNIFGGLHFSIFVDAAIKIKQMRVILNEVANDITAALE